MKSKRIIISLIISIIVALSGSFIKLPYYITKPGLVNDLSNMIHVENGYKEEGSFSLTTVRFGRATLFTYLWAKMQNDYEIMPIQHVRQEDESDEEYIKRQIHIMEASQKAAITIAYKEAGKKITIQNNGVTVLEVMKEVPAREKLKVGDRIVEADGMKIKTSEQFTDYLKGKKKGDHISLKINRDGKIIETSVELVQIPGYPNKTGLGVGVVTDKKLTTSPGITINTKDIGGPSAGLMMALEIYDQLTKTDLTKGLEIAGTGTINEKGEIGPIGGISQKVIAADRAGIDIFFAPNENGKRGSDYEEALKTRDSIHSDMKIIPVDTFDDAVHYLETMRTSG